jgi:uncharacterized protein (TIGR00106 family)
MDKEVRMLFELNIVPLIGTTHLGNPIAEVVRIIDSSGLPYRLTPCGTCIEGEWDEVLPLVRRCHERLREQSPHVMTTLHIEDEEGARDKLRYNVDYIAEKLGKAPERLSA